MSQNGNNLLKSDQHGCSMTKLSTLYYATGSKNKFEEYKSLLPIPDLRWSSSSVQEPQTLLYDVLIRAKIKNVQAYLPNLPFFVTHSGLHIRAWKDLPGALTSLFFKAVGNDGICKMMTAYQGGTQREAKTMTVIGYCAPDGHIETIRSEVKGTIAQAPRGKNGFGWDPIFIPNGYTQTVGEMSPELKNQVSMGKFAADSFTNNILQPYFKLAPVDTPTQPTAKHSIDLLLLQNLLIAHFDEEELRELCFQLRINYDDLRGEGRRGKMRELILYCQRADRLDDLISVCVQERPSAKWPPSKST